MLLCLFFMNLILSCIPVHATNFVGGDEEVPTEADFVIVGGGTAGCVLAARLCSDLPKHKTVLLERGAPPTDDEEFIVNSLREASNVFSELLPGDVDIFNYFPTEPNPFLSDPFTAASLSIVL